MTVGARILLVEDNPTNLQLMEYLLRAFGHTTMSATDGEAGVALAERERPDVILMDLQMPKLDGYQAVRRIRALAPLRDIPVVAVTAFAMVGDRDRILAHGFSGYISKPITPETFVDQVEAFVSRKGRPAAGASAASEAPVPPRPTGLGRILVVDNSRVNLSLAASILEPCGYEVVTADNVDDALLAARRTTPDLILSDVHMPGRSGYNFLQVVKDDETLKTVPFVFISSTVWGESERKFGIQQGADAFILRPIEPQALLREIGRHLRQDRGN